MPSLVGRPQPWGGRPADAEGTKERGFEGQKTQRGSAAFEEAVDVVLTQRPGFFGAVTLSSKERAMPDEAGRRTDAHLNIYDEMMKRNPELPGN
jgi:hypothetical protein